MTFLIRTFLQPSPRAIRRNLWLATALLAVGVITVIVWTVMLDAPQLLQTPTADTQTQSGESDTQSSDLKPLTLADFGISLDRPWRQPLTDAPTVVVKSDPPRLKLKLVGTMLEPSPTGPPLAMAMVLSSDGKLVTLRVGDKLEQATITAIEDGRVTVNYFDNTQVLTLDPS